MSNYKKSVIINGAYRQLDHLRHFKSNNRLAQRRAFISENELIWSIYQMKGSKE